MIEKEKFIILMTLKKFGLTTNDINTLMKKFNSKNKKYTTIIMGIERLIQWFIKDRGYDKDSFCTILKNHRMYSLSESKIEKIEKAFSNNQYTQDEIKHIIGNYSHILEQGPYNLDKKLRFYNDVELKETILITPENLAQELKISYARYKFLKAKGRVANIKKDIFIQGHTFSKKYGVSQERLLQAYPLPENYISISKAKTAGMSSKEKLILAVLFKQYGITPTESQKMIAQFESRMITYNVIVNALPKLKEYFMGERNCDKESFGNILRTVRIFNQSIDKIKDIEQILRDNDYSEEEIRTIETINPVVFCDGRQTLDQKLSFYNNIRIKNLIVSNPCHLWQSLKLSYARHCFFTTIPNYDGKQQELFISEEKFIDSYGIDNKTLIKTYPIGTSYALNKK